MSSKNDAWRPSSVQEPAYAYEALGAGYGHDWGTLIELVKRGVKFNVFTRLQQRLGLTELELASVLRIPSSTLARRKKASVLASDESERLLRLAHLYDLAVETFEDADEASRWMNTPRAALDGETPLQRSETEPGARQVEALLGRIEYGVFS